MRETGRCCRGMAFVGLLILLVAGGCACCTKGIPAYCVRPGLFDAPRSQQEPINFIRLRQDPPAVYMLGSRDILGIYIEGVLGGREAPPPVHFPEDADMPPAIGYPVPVREDGTISLPLVPPIDVAGLSLAQAEHQIRKAYTVDQRILQPGQERIIVTLMRPRTYKVLVVREDTSTIGMGGGEVLGTTKRGAAHVVDLRAYENDVLHALCESGGLPGVDAKNEVTILRGAYDEAKGPNAYLLALLETPEGPPSMQELERELLPATPNVVKIPLRIGPGEPIPELSQDDIILKTGDIVFIESREAEVFYTGGLIAGGQHLLPRDYDLDVLGAIAMAGGSVAAAPGSTRQSGFYGSGGGVGAIFPPTRITVVRTVNGRQFTIRTRVRRALNDPQERILIQPNDIVLLEYTPLEMALNVVLNNLHFNYFLNADGF